MSQALLAPSWLWSWLDFVSPLGFVSPHKPQHFNLKESLSLEHTIHLNSHIRVFLTPTPTLRFLVLLCSTRIPLTGISSQPRIFSYSYNRNIRAYPSNHHRPQCLDPIPRVLGPHAQPSRSLNLSHIATLTRKPTVPDPNSTAKTFQLTSTSRQTNLDSKFWQSLTRIT